MAVGEKIRVNVTIPPEQLYLLTQAAPLSHRDRSALIAYLADVGLPMMEERGELPPGTVEKLRSEFQAQKRANETE